MTTVSLESKFPYSFEQSHFKFSSPSRKHFLNFVFVLFRRAGFVADTLGSYPPAFYMAGSFVLLSAVLIFLVPFLKPDQTDHELQDTIVNELMIVEKCTVV